MGLSLQGWGEGLSLLDRGLLVLGERLSLLGAGAYIAWVDRGLSLLRRDGAKAIIAGTGQMISLLMGGWTFSTVSLIMY